MNLRIGLILRNIGERGGAAVYTRAILDALLQVDQDNEYVLAFASEADRQRYGRPGSRSLVVEAPCKAAWDHVAVARAFEREQVDLVFGLKHSIPLYPSAPRVMMMHGADWIAFPDNYYPLDRLYHGAILPLYLSAADRVITVSNDSAARIIAYMPEVSSSRAKRAGVAADSVKSNHSSRSIGTASHRHPAQVRSGSVRIPAQGWSCKSPGGCRGDTLESAGRSEERILP